MFPTQIIGILNLKVFVVFFFRKIKKDLNILCFNQNQLLGNGRVLPAGPLRENLSSVKNANIIIINGRKNLEFEKKNFGYKSKFRNFLFLLQSSQY